MRVLIVNQLGWTSGGRETYLATVPPALRLAGHEIGFAFEHLAPPGAHSLVGTDPGRIWHLPTDIEKIADWNPAVAYIHGLSSPEMEATLATRYPSAYYAHGYYGTCISGTKCHAFPSPVPCNRSFGPACLALYLPRRCGGLNPMTMVRSYQTERRRRDAIAKSRAVLVASRYMVDEFGRHAVSPERVHLVPYPATATPDRHAPAMRTQSGRILFVGRITALKGWSHISAAIRIASVGLGRPLTLVVAGDGPDREKFEAETKRAGISTEFLGWVSPERRDEEMRTADLLAVPSVWPEPFGLVGVEAGCVGLPAVGYAVGGIPDWLEPGVTGESAPGDRPDPKALASAIVRALCDPAHWQRLRIGAWEMAKRFGMDSHLDKLLPILEAAAG